MEAFRPHGTLCGDISGPYDTALEYYYDIRRRNYDMTQKIGREDLCIAAWLRLQAICFLVQPQFNRGPFPLHHTDLGWENFLFDNEYDITGVIVWTSAATMPIESFSRLPLEFIPYRDDASFQDNLIWYILEESERFRTGSTPLSEFLRSPESRLVPIFV